MQLAFYAGVVPLPDAERRAAVAARENDRARYERATAHLEPPVAIVDLAAWRANAAALVGHAAGKPIRIASKSLRCRALLADALARPGFAGVMAFTLAEAVWLARSGLNDVLVAYPTTDRRSLAELADDRIAAAVTVMVDDAAQLDLIDAALPADRPPVRVCLDLDASWRIAGGRLHLGVRRSPAHSPGQVAALAREVVSRRGFRLVGLMCYEAQIAGIGDAPPGSFFYAAAVRWLQRRSYAELLARRAATVARVREMADLEFVNGGGTGSLAATAADPSVTEVTAGSGLYGPTLFDAYRGWRQRPAALFALPVVRHPADGFITVSGGGWIASGPSGRSRLPTPWLPAGLRLIRSEGAGEVQTPLTGPGAHRLRLGDRVWFRHAKAGELCERVTDLHLVDGAEVTATVPTYRGEGKAFL